MSYPNNPIVSLSNLYFVGYGLTWNSNTSLIISEGQCYDSTLTYPIINNGPILLDATTHGLNGLDTGSLQPNIWYAICAIADPSYKQFPSQGVILTANYLGAPILPSGYGIYRRIGFVKTTGASTFQQFLQAPSNSDYKFYQWESLYSVLSSGSATSFTPISLNQAIPTTNICYLTLSYVPAAAGSMASIRPTGTTTLAAQCIIQFHGQVAGVEQIYSMIPIFPGNVSGIPSIDYMVSSGDILNLSISAWNNVP